MPSPPTGFIGRQQTLQAAREEIMKWSGRQFDPEVVKVFLEMPDNIWEDLRNEIHDADLPGGVFHRGQGLNPFAKVDTVERP